jgi:polyphosphate kinase
VHYVFNYLTAYSPRAHFGPLSVAPLNLDKNVVRLIDRETAHAKARRPAFIVAKVNALLDPDIIQALYRASRAGVQLDLIIRGACALRPGVRGVSSRIRVRSLVGRFLEHSRIIAFANGGRREVYLGSADWMQRNLYERVEVMFELKNPLLCEKVCRDVLAPYLADTEKARFLLANGAYTALKARPARGNSGSHFNVHEHFMRSAQDFGEGKNGRSPESYRGNRASSALLQFLTAGN